MGSEMCIRDRFYTHLIIFPFDFLLALICPIVGCICPNFSVGFFGRHFFLIVYVIFSFFVFESALSINSVGFFGPVNSHCSSVLYVHSKMNYLNGFISNNNMLKLYYTVYEHLMPVYAPDASSSSYSLFRPWDENVEPKLRKTSLGRHSVDLGFIGYLFPVTWHSPDAPEDSLDKSLFSLSLIHI